MPNKRKERKNTLSLTILGYDTLKWIKANAVVRDESQLKVDYRTINLISPHKGNHKFAQWQKLYEDVHGFLSSRVWAPVQPDSEVGGITWIELFILFDTTGNRSEDGQHQKSQTATRRAEKRKLNRSKTGKGGEIPMKLLLKRSQPWTKN